MTTEELRTGPSDLRRLTRRELERTLRDLFGETVLDAAAGATSSLPLDEVKDGYTTMSLGVTSSHVDGFFAVADRIAATVSADPTLRGALDPCLAAELADETCLQSFFDGFGRRVFRRPLLTEDREWLLELYRDGKTITPEDGFAAVLHGMLQAPPFLYRIELAGSELAEAPGTFGLTDWELATRLSYFVWGSAPDEALLDAAANGALATESGLRGELDRMLADPRAITQVRGFFSEWLGLEHLPAVDQSEAFLEGIPGTTLPDDMRAELERSITHHVFDVGDPYASLLTSRLSFVTTEPLGQVYGVSPGQDVDGQLELPAAERAGLLTRAALLMGTGETTHPIRRGVFVLRKLLCQELEPPNAGDFPPNTFVPPPFDASKNARERWTDKTSAPACAGCHQRINAYGFALESYDTLGRFRTEEVVVDPTTGEVVNELPIDTAVEVLIDGATPIAVDDAVELSEVLGASETANACFATQVFRFATGRHETSQDRGRLAAMLEAGTRPGGSMLDLFRAVAVAPQFRLRKPKM